MAKRLTPVLIMLLPALLRAQHTDLPKLIMDSDVVAVVKVLEIKPVEDRVVTIASRDYQGHFKIARLKTTCEIKGELPDDIDLPYSTISSLNGGGWSGGVPRGQSLIDRLQPFWAEPSPLRLVFLKRDGDGFVATDGSLVAFSVAPDVPCEKSASPFAAAISQLEATVWSTRTAFQEKGIALRQLRVSEQESVVSFLKLFLSSSESKGNDVLRVIATSALVQKGDSATLKDVVSELLKRNEEPDDSDYLYAISTGRFRKQDIATLATLMDSPRTEVRQAGAASLRHVGGPSAAIVLRRFRNDPDDEIRIQANQCVHEAAAQAAR